MMWIIIILIVLAIALLPLDAQYWLIGLVRESLVIGDGRALLFGAMGATLAAMIWYSWGWNDLAERLRNEDLSKADEAYRRRRRRWN